MSPSQFWEQLDPGLRTALVDAAIVFVGVAASWFVARLGRIKDRNKHIAEMDALRAQAETVRIANQTELDKLKALSEAGRVANDTFVRTAAEQADKDRRDLNERLDRMRAELNTAQALTGTTREQWQHDTGTFEGQIKILSDQNMEFAKRLAERDLIIAELQGKVATLTAALTATATERDQAIVTLTARNTERAEMQSKIAHLEGEVARLSSRVKELEAQVVKKPDTGPLSPATVAVAAVIETNERG